MDMTPLITLNTYQHFFFGWWWWFHCISLGVNDTRIFAIRRAARSLSHRPLIFLCFMIHSGYFLVKNAKKQAALDESEMDILYMVYQTSFIIKAQFIALIFEEGEFILHLH